MALHLDYCASFGLSKQDIESHPETIGKSSLPSLQIKILRISNTTVLEQHVLLTADTSSTLVSQRTGLPFKWLWRLA